MFDSRYEVYLADTEESRKLHHQVRYQVFCVERGFEDPEKFPDYLERDAWDQNSHHFVVKDRETGSGVGAMRIVLPTAGQLPVEQLNCITEEPEIVTKNTPMAEVSRICMVRDSNFNGLELPLQAVTPSDQLEVLLGLIRAVIRYSWDNDIPYQYMLVQRSFARMLKRLGVAFTQLGEGIEHRGLRVPYLIDMDATWEGMAARSDKVAEMFARHYLAYCSHAEMQPALMSPSRADVQKLLEKAAA